jgi:hypothetical protein
MAEHTLLVTFFRACRAKVETGFAIQGMLRARSDAAQKWKPVLRSKAASRGKPSQGQRHRNQEDTRRLLAL